MKMMILVFVLVWPICVAASDEYDNKYCKDPVELQKWATMQEKNPDDDAVAALHALWIGLCVKVEAHNITTQRANKIFEDFQWGVIESIKAQKEISDKSPS